MAEDEKKIDPRDLLGHERYDFRRTIPKDVYEGYKKLLIGEISEEEGRPQLVVARGINRTPETIEAKRHVPLKDFSKEERVRLDKLEKETVTLLIRDLIRPAVWSVSDNGNIVPYDTPRTTDRALEEIKLLREDLEEDFSRHSQRPNLRYEQVMGEISRVEEWLEGTAGELTSAPATMTPFFDGKNMLQFAVKAAGQDVKSDALAKLFDPVGKIRAESDPNTTVLESWKLGKEIERKQDAVFEIMRAVAATHRRKERNMGREIAEGNDYPVTEKQADFLEEVFGCEEKIEVLTDVGTVAETGTKLQNLKSRDKSAKLASVKAFDSTTEGINELRRTARNDEFIWVYGVKQPVNEATLESLKWLIGSGETIYLGEMVDQNRLGYVRGQVAILQEIPTEINNIFVTSQEPERTVPVKRMIALIAEMDAMRRLDEGENVNELLRELREKETSYKPTILDEHIVDMARITLLHFLEGADLGWGFEYAKDDGLSSASGEDVYKRVVAAGGTKAATDISTPLQWLRTEAGNTWKDWSKGLIPLTKETARQILDHEPGWTPPGVDGESWRIEFMGKPLDIEAPSAININFLESGSATMKVGQEKITAMRLIKEQGKKMSEIPFLKMDRDAQYRWYINLSQYWYVSILLTESVNRDVAEKFFGDNRTKFSMLQLFEMVKREVLAHRDTGKLDFVKRLIPYSLAMQTAWKNNMLPTSARPGMFDSLALAQDRKSVLPLLHELTLGGEEGIGEEMANYYKNYLKQLEEIGVEYRSYMARKRIRQGS